MSFTNYRFFSLDSLFEELRKYDIHFDPYTFTLYSRDFEEPEDVVESLKGEESVVSIVFEIWRRLFPEKATLSIFCYELDQLISQYEKGEPFSETELQEMLSSLLEVLNDSVDANVSPIAAFETLQGYFQHNLEDFLFYYILDQIEVQDLKYASDLIDDFVKFVEYPNYFDYAAILVEIENDPEVGFENLEKFIVERKNELEIDLKLEILNFLSYSGNHTLFSTLALQVIFECKTEDEFLEFANICLEHFEFLKLPSLADQVENLLQERLPRDGSSPFSQEDPDLLQLHKILTQKVLVS